MSAPPIRTFIAIELPPRVQESLYQTIAPLRAQADLGSVRWVAAEQLHLTLKFLGDVSPHNLELLADLLTREAVRHPPFFMRLEGLGVFPNRRRPRVLWLGVRAPQTLFSLQKSVEHAARQLGYAPDKRAFHPHLTLGRLRQPVPLKTAQALSHQLDTFSLPPLGDIRVDHITIYKSVLTRHGPVYTPLYQPQLQS